MHYAMKSCIIFCLLIQVVVAVYPMASSSNTQSLANLFLRSVDPAVSRNCFADYILQSKEVGESYGKEYNRCLLNAKEERHAVENEMAEKRIIISEFSQSVCTRLTTCEGLNTTLEVLNCHAKISENNTKAVYSISDNASEYATLMQEKYHTIDMHHDHCCMAAERQYVEATGIIYRTLQSCLGGQEKPLSTTSTTTTTTTTLIPTTSTTATETSSVVLEEEKTALLAETEQFA